MGVSARHAASSLSGLSAFASLDMVFFIDTQSGRVATRRQLIGAGLADAAGRPGPPWHPIQGPSDASTMWYAVLRKRERGVYIGTLCVRHTGRQASLERGGWQEVTTDRIGVDL